MISWLLILIILTRMGSHHFCLTFEIHPLFAGLIAGICKKRKKGL
uniref:Uncharacterized protein n=1 Tax=Rhizophora mucronata TaxID=61149 RepID=A0A2P2NKH2_RHIMU